MTEGALVALLLLGLYDAQGMVSREWCHALWRFWASGRPSVL